MKHLLSFLLVIFTVLTSTAQTNFTFLGKRTYNTDLSDVWGYASNGKEYALVGLRNGLSIVDVTNPATPTQVQFIAGPTTTWRDIKVWNNYAYVTNEASGGLLIVDLSGLPNQANSTYWTAGGLNLDQAHNIFIDENGIGYICGSNVGAGGVIFIDLNSNPTNPTVLGTYNTRYVHDLYVRNDTMWTAEVNAGIFSVVDVSDKSNPTIMATQSTPGSVTHNLWLTDDGKTLLTSDEISNAVVAAYDVSDLSNITELDRYQSSPGFNVTLHNVFILGDFAVISYYHDGVIMLDITNPNNMIEVGNFDTSPLSGSGFNGCWGVYPYLPSGNIIATDIDEGLFVLGPTYTKAAYLDGTVTDKNSTSTLNNVTVTIQGTSSNTITDLTGYYQTGIVTPGTYSVEYSRLGYLPHVEQNVVLQSGQTTTVDVELTPSVKFTLTGTVMDTVTGQGIDGATVVFENNDNTYTTTTAANGSYAIPFFETGNYTAIVGNWGHVTISEPVSLLTAGTSADFELGQGYYDDFALDFGWNVSGNASTGDWERDIPDGTTYNGVPSNPGNDVMSDISNLAFVTGNGGGSAGNDDVDDGTVLLTSPTFDLTNYSNPKLSYYRWFFNAGGSGNPDDELIVKLNNGITTVTVETLDANDAGANNWRKYEVLIDNLITPTANMQFTIETSDQANNGHIVEAGLDAFYVKDSFIVPAPMADFTASSTEGCEGAQVSFTDISSNNPSLWQWNFQGGTPSVSTLQNPTVTYDTAGTYSVTLTATNSGGSTPEIKNGFIVIHPKPSINVSVNNISCSGGNDGSINVNINNGLSPYTFTWGTGETTASINNLVSDNYPFTVTNVEGCSVSSAVNLGEPVALDLSATVVNTQCGLADGAISVTPSGGAPPYTYNWSNGATTDTAVNLNAGTYAVTLTDAKGCEFTKNFSVSNTDGPEIFFNTSHVDCPGDGDGVINLNIVGGTPAYTYNWSTGANTASISNLDGAIYSVTVTDANNCISIQDIEILEPEALDITMIIDDATCGNDNGSVFASVSGGTQPYTYSWSNSATSAVISNLTAGAYNITLTDSEGCTTSANANVVAVDAPNLTSQTTSASCKGKADGSVMLNIYNGTPPFQVNWSDGTNDTSRNNLPSGSYNVTVVDANQCITFTTVTIAADDSIGIDITSTPETTNGDQDGTLDLFISGGVGPFTIGLDNGSVYTSNNNQFTIDSLAAGSYNVAVLDASGCESQAAFTIGLLSSVNTVLQNAGIKVMPNPFNNQLAINYTPATNEMGEFNVFNILGKQVATLSAKPGETIYWGENADAGIYFIKYNGRDNLPAIKVIKAK